MRCCGVIRHILFDLDGTLVDSCATVVDILSAMRADRGSDAAIDPLAARDYMSRGGLAMIRGLLGETCVDPEADLADFRARYQRHTTSPETLYPDVAIGLARLRAAGLTLSICSNKPQNLCEKVLADTGLSHHFTAVIGGQPGLRPKPAPDLLDALLVRLGCEAGACVFVGDSELDHRIAADAAIPFHFLTHGYAEPGWEARDCAVHESFSSLTDALLARAAAHA